MKLMLESTGRDVTVRPPTHSSTTRGSLWQGETIDGVPVVALIVVLSPLIGSDDPRWEKFEIDRDTVMDEALLHREVDDFPSEVAL